MKLRKKIDFVQFLNCVKTCESEVYFCTKEGDRLNLKSTLSKYLFSAIIGNTEFIKHGTIECELPDDYERLQVFLSEE